MGLKNSGRPAEHPDDIITLGQTIRVVTMTTGFEVRPETSNMVFWFGGVTKPENMIDGDVWVSSATGGGGSPGTAPNITTTSLSSMTQSTATSQQLAATGDTPIAWSVTSGTLPAGLTLSSGGLLSGTPSGSGAYDFTVTASNSAGTNIKQYTGTITAAPPVGTDHTIFGTTAPTAYTAFDDGGVGSWTASQFYISASPSRSWFVKGARYYVPAGSAIVGKTAHAGLMRMAAADGAPWKGNGDITNEMTTNGYYTAFSAPLVAGWNEVIFATPLPTFSMDGMLIGIQVTGGYYVTPSAPASISNSSIQAADGANLYLSEGGGGEFEVIRNWYAPGATNKFSKVPQAQHYGQDIIVSETE